MNVSSRFSILNPDINLDTAFKTKTKKPKFIKKKIEEKKVVPKVVTKKQLEVNDLQALAFGKVKGGKKPTSNGTPTSTTVTTTTTKPKTKDKKTKSSKLNNNLDEQWKKVDEEFVEKANENALREAIIQSKLDFEEDKKVKISKLDEEKANIKKIAKPKKKKDKPITLSLNQFISLDSGQIANLKDPSTVIEKPLNDPSQRNGLQKFDEEKFFKDVEEATKSTLEKEKRQEHYKNNANRLNNEIQVTKFKAEIEKRDFEIQALRLEVEALRSQLLEVKTRNKKLCDVISCSEMRSKGELVVEMEKMAKGRDEFSEEVTRLNCELEQERTKTSNLTNELKKMQGKKRTADYNSK